jgi:hypothetical protein
VVHEERVVRWISASAITSSLLIMLFVDVDPRRIGGWAVAVVRDAGFYIGATAMVVGSIRAIRRDASTVARGLQVVVGLVLFGLLIGGPLATRHILLSSRDAWSHDIEPIYAEKVRRTIDNRSISMEKRSFASSVLAAEIYAKKGEIVSVISTDGKNRLYEPDESARELRRNILKTRSIAEFRLPRLESQAWFTAVVLLASVGVGLKSSIAAPAA